MTTATEPQAFAEKVLAATTGVKITIHSTGTTRTLTKEAVGQVADLFGAGRPEVGARKRILDTKHPAVGPVYQCLRDAQAAVHRLSFDYPVLGVRLTKLANIEKIRARVDDIRDDLRDAAQEMYDAWDEIREERQRKLGRLYDPADYAADPRQLFGIELSFPDIGPDRRLEALHPDLYKEERDRLAVRVETAVRDAEEAAVNELAGALEHLIDRLTPEADGTPKTIKQSNLDNLTDYCEYYQSISLGSNETLDTMVARVREAAASTNQKALKRGGKTARERLTATAQALKADLEKIVVERPARRIKFAD